MRTLVVFSGAVPNLQGLLSVNLHRRIRASRPVPSINDGGADLAGVGGVVLALLYGAFKLPRLLANDCLLSVLRWTHVVMLGRFVLLQRQFSDRLLNAITGRATNLEAADLRYCPPALRQLFASCLS